MNFLKNYWIVITGVIGILSGVFGWVYQQGVTMEQIQSRSFDSVSQKVKVVDYVEDAPSPIKLREQFILDSLDKVSRIKSRAHRDSLMDIETALRKKTDSVLLLNADQVYQIKQQLKEISDKIN